MTQANLFDLRDAAFSITYSNSGIDGKPHFTYKKDGTTRTFTGDQIDQQETVIGTLVSVTLKSIPDLQSTVLSVLIPYVNIPPDKMRVIVKTQAIVTTIRTSFGGPQLVSGQIQTYKAWTLKGFATAVQF